MADWLGGHDPLENARADDVASSLLANVPKEERANLTVSEKAKVKTKAEEGMKSKFKLVPALDKEATKEQLEAVYSVAMRVEEFQRSLRQHELDDVFTIPDSFQPNADPNVEEEWPAGDAGRIDILHEPRRVTLDDVKKWSVFLLRRGQGYGLFASAD